ncbi:PREDICTED: uncharacterized protein LOC108758648 [Trachymyrmex cornetzi]|uniref:uncharacterized protein LOC108758648 n=1 Tax=Trachymyrmex cornetzi TaxID=471704 RepID=UPI00084F1636|nr:PREDICTED: uncharacterized protein LOC108758648 [Trachymyrmex cornetzi]
MRMRKTDSFSRAHAGARLARARYATPSRWAASCRVCLSHGAPRPRPRRQPTPRSRSIELFADGRWPPPSLLVRVQVRPLFGQHVSEERCEPRHSNSNANGLGSVLFLGVPRGYHGVYRIAPHEHRTAPHRTAPHACTHARTARTHAPVCHPRPLTALTAVTVPNT